VAVTDAFQLDAKYIIHTVGPEWEDGYSGEFAILESCYVKSLQKAVELKCNSIAFPLIATGVYGFPKDRALQVAISVFSNFLMEHEMQIILVVFDKKSYQLSSELIGEVDSYIDSNYVKKRRFREYDRASSTRVLSSYEEESVEYTRRFTPLKEDECSFEEPEDACKSILSMPASLEDELSNMGETFHEKLFQLIEAAGLDNKDVWKLANLDRKHFSKIQCDANYHPKKKTVMALCIALKLDLEQAKDLMARADWAFSPSSKVDLIVQKAIIDKKYDIMQLNLVLFEYTNETLGV